MRGMLLTRAVLLAVVVCPALPCAARAQAEGPPAPVGSSAAAPAEPSGGDAEPAPPESVPGTARRPLPDPLPPRVRVAADARLAVLLGGTRDVAPPLGWGFGLQLSASLLPLGRLRLGFVADYQQDRFTRTFAQRPDAPQQLIHSTFAAQALLDLPTRWLRPYLAAGVGASVSRYVPPQEDLAEETALSPLFRFSAGLGISPLRWLELTLSTDVSITVSERRGGVTQEPNGLLVPAMGPLFSPGWASFTLAAGYRFY